MNRMCRVLFFVVLANLISGCAIVSTNIGSDSSGPKAELTFYNLGRLPVSVETFRNGYLCQGMQKPMGIFTNLEAGNKEKFIYPADRIMSSNFRSMRSFYDDSTGNTYNSAFQLIVSYKIEDGKRYEIYQDDESSIKSGRYGIGIYQIVNDDKNQIVHRIKVPYIIRKHIPPKGLDLVPTMQQCELNSNGEIAELNVQKGYVKHQSKNNIMLDYYSVASYVNNVSVWIDAR